MDNHESLVMMMIILFAKTAFTFLKQSIFNIVLEVFIYQEEIRIIDPTGELL